jgi:predicted metal-dependent hydrolase
MPSTKALPLGTTRLDSYSVVYGTSKIFFDLEYSDRKTLSIEVYPDQHVLVKAPVGSSISTIESKVSDRASWITRQQRKFATYAPNLPAPEYKSGEGYRYLGRQCRLKVIQSDRKTVRLWASKLEVYTPDVQNQASIEQMVKNWYRNRAQSIFATRYQICLQIAARYDIQPQQDFELRTMEKRWGSCSSQGKITLNPLLVSAPKDCIDYVIMHELCHLKFHNHSPDFYRLLSLIMPNWQVRKNYLNARIELRQELRVN